MDAPRGSVSKGDTLVQLFIPLPRLVSSRARAFFAADPFTRVCVRVIRSPRVHHRRYRWYSRLGER